MRTSLKLLSTAAALTAMAGAYAQGDVAPPQQSNPAAASSEHQREATRSPTSEAPATTSPEASAASSPHQRDVANEKMSSSKLKMAKQEGAIPASFVKKAALDGMTEVQLGKVALEKSQDPKVRQFAQKMITDHGKANEELAAVAQSKNLDVPKSLDSEHEAMVRQMSSKDGAAFDAAYREHMNADHSEAIALFQGASTGRDQQLAALAKKTLPTLEEHKHMAEALPSGRSAEASTPQAR